MSPPSEPISPVAARSPAQPDRAGWWADSALLVLVCAVLYLPGLWSVGLSTWHEAQRALVAREMHAAGEWIVPLINGRPYLAKPPLFYWCQLVLAPVFGGATDERVLRTAAALWGTLGVVAAYVVGRALARRGLVGGLIGDTAGRVNHERTSRWTGLLAGLFLATGPMYLHHCRVGEIDILLPALVTLAIGAMAILWIDSRPRPLPAAFAPASSARLAWGLCAIISATLAALGKGPPALGVIIAGVLGGVLLWAGVQHARRDVRRDVIAGLVGAAAAVVLVVGEVTGPKELLGAGLGMAYFALAAVMLVRVLTSASALRAAGLGVWRSGLAWALLIALLTFGAWAWAAVSRIGLDTARNWKEGEAESNFRWLEAEVPYITLETALWAVGVGSALGLAAMLWAIWQRPRVRPAGFVLLAWLLLGSLIFACFGKGFPRYLLPIWPCLAIIGGAFAAQVLARSTDVRWRARLAAALGVMIVAEAAWFGVGHARVNADKSPRDLIAELLSPAHGVKPQDLTVFQFWTAAVDYYAGVRPMIVGDVLEKDQNVGSRPLTEAEFAERLKSDGESRVVLVREGDRPDRVKRGRAVDGPQRLRNLGLTVEPIDTRAEFRFDGGRSRVIAVRVRWAGEAARP
jgi:4-amino-4-deoxy-L-arabinose transferase-like glycosyltransferase